MNLDEFWPFAKTLKIVLYSKYLDNRRMNKILPEKVGSSLKIFLFGLIYIFKRLPDEFRQVLAICQNFENCIIQ